MEWIGKNLPLLPTVPYPQHEGKVSFKTSCHSHLYNLWWKELISLYSNRSGCWYISHISFIWYGVTEALFVTMMRVVKILQIGKHNSMLCHALLTLQTNRRSKTLHLYTNILQLSKSWRLNFLVCDADLLVVWFQTFWRIMVPSSSGSGSSRWGIFLLWRWRQYDPSKPWDLHAQKTQHHTPGKLNLL
jgi:hypothetical protein